MAWTGQRAEQTSGRLQCWLPPWRQRYWRRTAWRHLYHSAPLPHPHPESTKHQQHGYICVLDYGKIHHAHFCSVSLKLFFIIQLTDTLKWRCKVLENAVIENGFKLRLASQSFIQHPLSRVKFSIDASLTKILVSGNKHVLRSNVILFTIQRNWWDGPVSFLSLHKTLKPFNLAYPCRDKCSICFICCGQELVKIEVGSGINGVNTSVVRVGSVGVSLQRVQDRGQVWIGGLPFCKQITVTWNFLQQWTKSNIDKGIIKIWRNVEGCSEHISVKRQQIRYIHFIRHIAPFFKVERPTGLYVYFL